MQPEYTRCPLATQRDHLNLKIVQRIYVLLLLFEVQGEGGGGYISGYWIAIGFLSPAEGHRGRPVGAVRATAAAAYGLGSPEA